MTSLDTVAGTQMKITARSEELADILAVAGRGVSTRTTVHVLTGILLRAEAGRLAVASTDMELSLRLELDATVEDEGAVVVPGRLLVDIARLLPPGEVTLEYRPEEGTAKLTCGPAEYSLNTFAVEDFPRLPELDGDEPLLGRSPGVPRHDREGRPLRVARRVAPGAHRRSRQVRGRQARDGCDRLVPAERQGDGPADRPGPRARGDRAGACAPGARARGRRRRPRTRSTSGSSRTRSSSPSTASR